MTSPPRDSPPDRLAPARALLLLVFGLAYVWLVPSFRPPDEAAHFARAHGVAEGQLILRDHPAEHVRVAYDAQGYALPPEARESDPDARVPNLAWNTSLYSPAAYALPAGALWLTDRLRLDPMRAVRVLRVVMLLFFVGIITAISKLWPAAAWSVFWLASTPVALSSAASVSLDPMLLLATLLLLTSCLAKLTALGHGVLVLLGAFFLLQTKLPYLPLLGIPFLGLWLAGDKRRSGDAARVALASAVSIAAALWWHRTAQALYQDPGGVVQQALSELGGTVDPRQQLASLADEPWRLFSALSASLIERAPLLFRQAIGMVGRQDVPIPYLAAGAWLLLVPILPLVEAQSADFARGPNASRQRTRAGLGLLALAGLTVASVLASIYLALTPVGASRVQLIFGRHLHPMILVALLAWWALCPRRLREPAAERARLMLLVLAAGLNACACAMLWP